MSDIKTNMRRLKRVPGEDGLKFTLETAAEQEKDNLLCNFCGWRDLNVDIPKCPKYTALARYAKKGVGLLIRTCETYQPILTFRLTKKMEDGFKGEFNTFRLGATWHNRVSPGVICALYDTGKKEVFGKAMVTATYNGDMEEMCFDHAWKNHLFMGLDQEDAASKMESAMRNAYGHIMEYRKNSICTVINLERIT